MTRAEPGAARTAARLVAFGCDPVVQPLLRIEPLTQVAPDLTEVAALAFTSLNGVQAFSALSPVRDVQVFAVGDATADAARLAGFADVASAKGALEDLGRIIPGKLKESGVILVPGAREPAGDLARLLPGLIVRPLPLYASVETGAGPPPDPVDAVLVHSPRAGRALAALWPRLTPPPRVVAISANAAAPLRGLRRCAVARAPTEDSLFDALAGALGNRLRPV